MILINQSNKMKKNKTIYRTAIIMIAFLMTLNVSKIYSQTGNLKTKLKMDTIQTLKKSDAGQQIFIDKFFVPENAKQEFDERMKISRDFIKKLPGLIEDHAYERMDENGNFNCVTMAIWENEDAINKARQAVQAEYKREGFDMQGMFKRLNITIDRGVYKKVEN